MKLIKWFSVVLSISLGANFWFIYSWYLQQNAIPTSVNANLNGQNKVRSHAWQTPTDNLNIGSEEASNNPVLSNQEPSVQSQSEFFAWLKSLASAHQFEKLEFEVRKYLRVYPQDIDALLLEALAYYHNKPLNTALVHYHELLTLPLTGPQQTEIEKLIAINTTRIIQQFSGDGAWDLLAEFLEPLVQVAPRERQYLMALARAYGMQSQFSLMESALASFPADDIRAIRLRENVTARLNQTNDDESLRDSSQLVNQNSGNNQGQADVLLQQKRGQFITAASVHNTSVNLLVDTGASTTALSDTKFSSIDPRQVEFLGVFNVSTAGGSIEAPIYKVNRITIGQQTLTNTSVLILPSDNLGQYDGLLGMNVLSQFDLNYDAASETMRMYRKR